MVVDGPWWFMTGTPAIDSTAFTENHNCWAEVWAVMLASPKPRCHCDKAIQSWTLRWIGHNLHRKPFPSSIEKMLFCIRAESEFAPVPNFLVRMLQHCAEISRQSCSSCIVKWFLLKCCVAHSCPSKRKNMMFLSCFLQWICWTRALASWD